jgi:BirA family biotin operon repressor/biotin-[acetyl-CoA-carboxylase] ligase
MTSTFKELPKDYDFVHLDQCQSTMDEGLSWLKQNQHDDRMGLILADRQQQGRGQRQRFWHSLEGNLFVSFAFMIPKNIKTFSELSFVGAVALGEALRTLYPAVPLSYKWPNDMMVDGKKVGGILTETHDLDDKRGVVMGMGVNLAVAPTITDKYDATSLKEMSKTHLKPIEVLQALVPLFDRYRKLWLKEGFLKIAKEWERYALCLKESVCIMTTRGPFKGIFQGIDHQGFFKLQVPSGEILSFSSVDIMKET